MLKSQYNTNYGFHAVQQISRTYSFCITETFYLCNSEGRCFLFFFFNKVSVIKKIICIKNKDTSVLKKIICFKNKDTNVLKKIICIKNEETSSKTLSMFEVSIFLIQPSKACMVLFLNLPQYIYYLLWILGAVFPVEVFVIP